MFLHYTKQQFYEEELMHLPIACDVSPDFDEVVYNLGSLVPLFLWEWLRRFYATNLSHYRVTRR